MKRNFFNRAVSLTAAVTLSLNLNVLERTGIKMTASADEQVNEQVNEQITEETELVPVIVRVSGDAVLATPEGIAQGDEFLDTEEAAEISETLEDVQTAVQDEIREFYPELDIKYSYSVLYNGFACEIPKNMVERVKGLPYVEAVAEIKENSAPNTGTDSEMYDYPAYYDFTGCSGKGQVIAVIDNGFNIDHPMFSALDDSVEVKLTPESIEEIASTIGFNVDIDPEIAYRSSKLPYVIDYYDDDLYNVLDDDGHGTHVSGIAAGNEFTAEDGNTYSGIAKDAQLILMAVGASGRKINSFSAIAAMEDAVKLHADVINMSFGSSGEIFGENPYQEAYDAAINAGITVCVAAGNSANTEPGNGAPTPDQPDTQTIDSEAFSDVLAVASAGNSYTQHIRTLKVGGENIPYLGVYRKQDGNNEVFLSDELSGEYEYVYCGKGSEEEIKAQDVKGKIVLATRQDCGIFPEDKIKFAKEAGAVGFIASLREDEPLRDFTIDTDLPYGAVSYADFQKMIEAENKVLTFSDETFDVDVATSVSDFTSWGVKNNLELRPDIMGIGGHVVSANIEGDVITMSGTSMSSPYVAGCIAVLDEYLEKLGIKLEGAEKVRYIRNLVMTSAFPYEEDGMFVTPRRQGAGMISLNNVISDKVILTGNEGESKIQLFDNVGDDFSFDINLDNISEEDVEFKSARLVLTTDSTKFSEAYQKEIIGGQQELSCSADLDGLLSIGKGENRTETINVSLDAEQTAAIKETFTNGFFVEGYLLLEGAENCCDISVPILGFYGNWAAVPIFDDVDGVYMSMGADEPLMCGYSPAKLTKLIQEILPDDYKNYEGSVSELIGEYATDEQKKALEELKTDTYYISPNGDGLADHINLETRLKRAFAQCTGLNIYDSDGNLVATGTESTVDNKNSFLCGTFGPTYIQEDGVYTAQVTGCINYPSSLENPQTKEVNFIVDTKAPELESELVGKDGRQILQITATDEHLDGIYITGFKGTEGEKELDSLQLAGYYTKEYLKNPDMSANTHAYNASELPPIGKYLTGETETLNLDKIDFSDLIVAEPDENGIFTFEYDVTDLSSYTFAVMDRAYNVSVLESEAAPAEEVSDGVYMFSDGLVCFADGKMSITYFKDGSVKESPYTLKDGIINAFDSEIPLEQADSDTFRMNLNNRKVTMQYYGEGTLENYKFYTLDQIRMSVESYLIDGWECKNEDVEINLKDGIATVSAFGCFNGETIDFGSYGLNIFTGEINVLSETDLLKDYIFPITFEDADPRRMVMFVVNSSNEIYYADFEEGKLYSQQDGSSVPLSYEINNTELKFIIDGEEKIFPKHYLHKEGYVFLSEDGETYDKQTIMINCMSSSIFRFYNNNQLKEMAADYYEATHGTRPENIEAVTSMSTVVSLKISETEYYNVSVFDATGTDEKGNPVDLTAVLAPMEDIFKSGRWVAYEYGNDFYLVFNDDNTMQFIGPNYMESATYEMTSNGIFLTNINDPEDTDFFKVYPQEDGSVIMWYDEGGYAVHASRVCSNTETPYLTSELAEMAKAHYPAEVQNAEAEQNPDGSVSVYLMDENNSVIESYILDVMTATGFDSEGNPVDIKEAFIPELPEGAYSTEKLCDMAKWDYKKKNGRAASCAVAEINKDGSVTIELTDKDGKIIDTYRVDSVTGKGTDSDGKSVNLPKTGNNAPDILFGTSASAFLTLAGFFTVFKSGVLRRKKKDN